HAPAAGRGRSSGPRHQHAPSRAPDGSPVPDRGFLHDELAHSIRVEIGRREIQTDVGEPQTPVSLCQPASQRRQLARVLRWITEVETDEGVAVETFDEGAIDVMPLDDADLQRPIEDTPVVDDETWTPIEELHRADEGASAEEHDGTPTGDEGTVTGGHEE